MVVGVIYHPGVGLGVSEGRGVVVGVLVFVGVNVLVGVALSTTFLGVFVGGFVVAVGGVSVRVGVIVVWVSSTTCVAIAVGVALGVVKSRYSKIPFTTINATNIRTERVRKTFFASG
jgi:hypothetical protein